MYTSLYENEEIEPKLYFSNSKEIPSIASIKQRQFSNVKFSVNTPLVTEQNLPAVAAAEWPEGQDGLDSRPRFIDPKSGKSCLVDSGSAITAIEAGPEDVPQPNLALIAANGTLIECCGYKTITIQLGRKKYQIKAAIARIQGMILGMF